MASEPTVRKPLAVDLFCGLGGWTEGFLAAGWDVIGFDIERHIYGEHRYPAQLVLQDVRTLHGSQFKDADMIVASSPCQEFSYRAMPWKRAKALPPPHFGMELFSQAARIQREASEAAARHIPMIQENVKGAQKWVGRAKWHYGSYYLWGDVPALMPVVQRRGAQKVNPDGTSHGTGSWFAVADSKNRGASDGTKNPGFRFDGRGKSFQSESVERHTKNDGGSWFNVAHNTTSGHGKNPVHDGIKQGGDWLNAEALDRDGQQAIARRSGSKSSARKAASARIAKIPFPLAFYIAETFRPALDAAGEEGTRGVASREGTS